MFVGPKKNLACHLPSSLIPTFKWIPIFVCNQYSLIPKSAATAAMMRTSGKLPSLAIRAAALASTQRHGGVKYGDSRVSIWGECGGDGWVESGDISPLSRKGSVRLSSLMAISVG